MLERGRGEGIKKWPEQKPNPGHWIKDSANMVYTHYVSTP